MTGSGFDTVALHDALEERRGAEGLSWTGVADAIWQLSAELNVRRDDHPISPSTLIGMPRRRAISCQHALFMLRWLERSPESFLVDPLPGTDVALPAAGPDRRLRWHLHARPIRDEPGLAEALDDARRSRDLTWDGLAEEIGGTSSQLSGLRRARFAIGMDLAMAITQWLERPAADFVYAARW